MTTTEPQPVEELGGGPDFIDTDGDVLIAEIRDFLNTQPQATDAASYDTVMSDIEADLASTASADTLAGFKAVMGPVQAAVDSGQFTVTEADNFLRWLAFNRGVTSVVNDSTTTTLITGYIATYAAEQGLTPSLPAQGTQPPPVTGGGTTTPPVVTPPPTTSIPVVLQPVATNPAPPIIPHPAPVTLPPGPTPGQQVTVAASTGVTSSTVTGGTDQGTSAAQVSAALAVTAVNILEVVARVFDAFLPGMAPGQVPQALGQLNQALHVTEDQLAILRATTTGHATGSLSGQITALQGVVASIQAAIAQLQSQMAEKADSGLEDGINANTAEIAALSGTLGALIGTTIPALTNKLDTTAANLGALDDTVTNEVEPQLAKTAAQADATTTELSGTDKECLDELCDAINNVAQPIEQGGATPSLLKKLGGLLGTVFAAAGIMAALEALETLLDAPAVVTAVVQDTETMSLWATQAAAVIEADFSWSGGLDVNIRSAS